MGTTEGRLKLRETELEWREVEGQVLALDLRRSQYFSINHTGRTLWDALAAGATHEDLVEKLIEVHGAERDQAASDARAFVDALEARELIVRGPAATR